MLIRSLLVATAATSLTLAAVPALASGMHNALDRAVASENWPLAIELVDRQIVAQGASDELMAYRTQLVGLNTRTMLASRSDPQNANLIQTAEVNNPVTEREREREAFFANRAARLAAREVRRQERNRARLLNAEIAYWRTRSRTRGSRFLGSPVLARRAPFSPVASSALARRIAPQRASVSQTTTATNSQMTERERYWANRAARLAARDARRERRIQERQLNAEIALLRDRRRRRGPRLQYSPVSARRALYSRIAYSD